MSYDADNSDKRRLRLVGVLRKCAPGLIVLVAVAAVFVLKTTLRARTRDLPPTDPPVVDVTVETVESLPKVLDMFVVNGVVEPNLTVKVCAEVEGQIKSYGRRKKSATWLGREYSSGGLIDEGEPISQGDPIILLDTDLLQAEHDRARVQFELDEREHTRATELFEKGVATRTGLDRAKAKMDVSKATLVTARERFERATIEAPISGILNGLPEEVGHFVQPGVCVAEIVDIGVVKVVVEVSERNVPYLKVGDKAEVLVDQRDGRKVTGEITFISELADEQAHTTRVEVSVKNDDRLLRSGQIVRVRLTRQILTDVIMIPFAAAIPLESGRVVYVVNDDHAVRRDVELNLRLIKGSRVYVVKGLAAGEQLIVAGHRYVGPGQKVRVPAQAAGDSDASAE